MLCPKRKTGIEDVVSLSFGQRGSRPGRGPAVFLCKPADVFDRSRGLAVAAVVVGIYGKTRSVRARRTARTSRMLGHSMGNLDCGSGLPVREPRVGKDILSFFALR